MLSLLQFVYAPVRYSVMRKLTIESVEFVSVAGVVLPLQPLFPVVIVCDLICSCIPLLGGVLHLTDLHILIFVHRSSAYGHCD